MGRGAWCAQHSHARDSYIFLAGNHEREPTNHKLNNQEQHRAVHKKPARWLVLLGGKKAKENQKYRGEPILLGRSHKNSIRLHRIRPRRDARNTQAQIPNREEANLERPTKKAHTPEILRRFIRRRIRKLLGRSQKMGKPRLGVLCTLAKRDNNTNIEKVQTNKLASYTDML